MENMPKMIRFNTFVGLKDRLKYLEFKISNYGVKI